jgi:hypothetical protein
MTAQDQSSKAILPPLPLSCTNGQNTLSVDWKFEHMRTREFITTITKLAVDTKATQELLVKILLFSEKIGYNIRVYTSKVVHSHTT